MSQKRRVVAASLTIMLAASMSGHSTESAASWSLYLTFWNNYAKARSANFGLFEMPDDRKAMLDLAHQQVLRALREDDGEAFRKALLDFMSVPRDHKIALAKLGKLLTYGAGPSGTRAGTASDAFNSTMSAGAEAAMRNANFSEVTCSYFFSEPDEGWWGAYKRCTPEAIDDLFKLLSSDHMTIAGFYERIKP